MVDIVKLKASSKSVFANVSWDIFHYALCGAYNWSMVNIHSRNEQDLIGFYLQHKMIINTTRYFQHGGGYYGYTYIGNV